ncbi:MAG: helix-turn-helix domain-containing protein [Blautia sp.]|nr:helix-turn-helix domain-containing protein [Blautia sp.]MCM1202499.1 helix-turn-helix domain-containing protein [Bacteroides fragilis]
MKQETLLISEAAKQVQVESHVLRYWEEELQLPIKRNDMGHRYYTMEDVKQFREIKLLKEQGLQLKAIKNILQKESGGTDTADKPEEGAAASKEEISAEEKAIDYIIGRKQKYIVSLSEEAGREEKANRLQYLLQHMMVESVRNANKELCTEIKESLLKELDYQFRMREEREEEHWKKEEEHYRKVDEMLRQHYKHREKPVKPRKERKKGGFLKH